MVISLQKASKEVSEIQLGKPDVRMKGTPKTFLKKCQNCGAEIPIASEEWPHCKTKQEQIQFTRAKNL